MNPRQQQLKLKLLGTTVLSDYWSLGFALVLTTLKSNNFFSTIVFIFDRAKNDFTFIFCQLFICPKQKSTILSTETIIVLTK